MPSNNAVTRWLARAAEEWTDRIMSRRKPDFVIGGADGPYLNRWWAIPRNPCFNIYIHEFRASDDDRALHDHPFASVSLALRGEMHEVYLDHVRYPELDRGFQRTFINTVAQRSIRPGDLVYRSAKFAHRMIVPTPGAVTLFITGPRIREWGFHCPRGWIPWREFVDTRDKGAVGRGCD